MYRTTCTFVSSIAAALVLATAPASSASGRPEPPAAAIDVPGYVTHGVNVFNDEFLTDYSDVSPQVFWLMPPLPIMEMGAQNLDPNAVDASRVDGDTALDLPVATIRSFADNFNPGGVFDPSIFNRPLDEIGVSPYGYIDLTERILPVPFDEAVPGDLYQAADTLPRPTVADWNRAGGLLRYRCRPDGSATVRIAIRNAMPNAVYTLWDIGALHPLTENEIGYASPFGGVPNILLTDADGCGYKRIEVPFCPGRPCEAGGDSCTSYVSAFLHWDNQVYGGGPAATFAGMPIGVLGSNHVMFPLSGTPLQAPHNEFRGHHLRCPD